MHIVSLSSLPQWALHQAQRSQALLPLIQASDGCMLSGALKDLLQSVECKIQCLQKCHVADGCWQRPCQRVVGQTHALQVNRGSGYMCNNDHLTLYADHELLRRQSTNDKQRARHNHALPCDSELQAIWYMFASQQIASPGLMYSPLTRNS